MISSFYDDVDDDDDDDGNAWELEREWKNEEQKAAIACKHKLDLDIVKIKSKQCIYEVHVERVCAWAQRRRHDMLNQVRPLL